MKLFLSVLTLVLVNGAHASHLVAILGCDQGVVQTSGLGDFKCVSTETPCWGRTIPASATGGRGKARCEKTCFFQQADGNSEKLDCSVEAKLALKMEKIRSNP